MLCASTMRGVDDDVSGVPCLFTATVLARHAPLPTVSIRRATTETTLNIHRPS